MIPFYEIIIKGAENMEINQINSLLKKVQKLISKERINEIAIETKFIQRTSSKITAESFFELNVFDKRNVCTESLEELSAFLYQSKNIDITSQSLDGRFNSKAVDFFKQIFQEIVFIATKNNFPINTKFTDNFNSIKITDSSNIELPNNCKNEYKGFGGSANESAARLQLTYDIKSGGIVLVDVSDITKSDAGFLSTLERSLEKNDLEIKDLGYFSIKNFEVIEESSAYYLSRLKTNTSVYTLNPNPEKFKTGKIRKSTEYIKLDLVEESQSLKLNEIKELDVFIGRNKVKTRLIIYRLPEESVEKKLVNQKKTAHKKQIKISDRSKNLSIANIYITNVPSDIIPKEHLYLIYSLRWQIEIIFKILKSTLEIDKVKKVKLERIQCHIYSSLIKMFLNSLIVFGLREIIYDSKSKEISELKAFKIVNNFFEELKNALFYFSQNLKGVLTKIATSILKNGIKSKHNKKKTVFEILLLHG